MRARLATCIVAIWTTGLLTAAKAETWCIRDRAGEICAFSSAHDCIRAALVGPAGGTACAQQTRRPVENDRRGAFPNGDFRPNSGHRESDTESGRRRESTSDANRRSA